MGVVILVVIVATWVWVWNDAKKRDWSQKKHGAKTASGQIIGVVIFWIIFFPVYLVQRRNVPLLREPRAAPPATRAPVDEQRFKSCPDCAETILLDAKVCKHCHYRFDQATTEAL
jgi:hypothetical protein